MHDASRVVEELEPRDVDESTTVKYAEAFGICEYGR